MAGNLYSAVKAYFKNYFDMSADLDDHATAVKSIIDGVSFKGTNIVILIIATFIASLGVMVPSIVISLVVAIFLRKAADAKWMKLLMQGVRPCVVGIIGAAVIFFAKTAICWQGAVIFALVVLIRWKWAKLNPIWSLAVSALLGWVLFLV